VRSTEVSKLRNSGYLSLAARDRAESVYMCRASRISRPGVVTSQSTQTPLPSSL